jgi:hypothetical protein
MKRTAAAADPEENGGGGEDAQKQDAIQDVLANVISTPASLYSPMLTVQFFLCSTCRSESRRRPIVRLPDGKYSVQLVVCGDCMKMTDEIHAIYKKYAFGN